MENAIELINISKQYPGFQLKDVSFQVPKGCIMGFVGENGAGKSTTIKAILNLVHLDGGEIRVFGKNIQEYEKEIKQDIGVVFDESYFQDSFRLKNVASVMRHVYRNWDDTYFENICRKWELPSDRKVEKFSRGMKMKLSIATALAHHPRLLILDEATSGLDPIVRDEILDIFLEFIQEEEHTILVSSHIISDLEKIADYITFIHKGEICFSCSKDILLYEYGIVKGTEEQISALDQKHVLAVRRNQFGAEALADNKEAMGNAVRNLTVDSASIEDIMLFLVKGERR